MNKSQAPFLATRWTLIQAVQGGSPQEAAAAMEDICRQYWYPIYAFLRRSQYSPADAEDLTQAFFQKLVTEESLLNVRQEKGRLRSFLLAVLKNVIRDHTRHENALKRGGGMAVISFDELQAEERYAIEPVDLRDPETLFQQSWAHELLDRVRLRLRTIFEKMGRTTMFDALAPFLSGDEVLPPCSTLATQLDSSEGAVRLLVHRLRKNFKDMLEAEIASTVVNPEDVAVEMAWLRQMLTAG